MLANKIFFDIYSTSGGSISKEDYKRWYDYNDTVYIALLDAGIYTKVPRKEMFNKNMHHGCFIEHYSYATPELRTINAMEFMLNNKLLFVDPNTFIKIESKHKDERVAKAFAKAEELIKQG